MSLINPAGWSSHCFGTNRETISTNCKFWRPLKEVTSISTHFCCCMYFTSNIVFFIPVEAAWLGVDPVSFLSWNFTRGCTSSGKITPARPCPIYFFSWIVLDLFVNCKKKHGGGKYTSIGRITVVRPSFLWIDLDLCYLYFRNKFHRRMQEFCVEYLHMNPSCGPSQKSCPKCCHIHAQVAGYTLPSPASTMHQKAYILRNI